MLDLMSRTVAVVIIRIIKAIAGAKKQARDNKEGRDRQ
jgi:hypothetical protein